MTRTAWLASYPKSGNTWIRAMLSALENDDDPRLNAMSTAHNHDGMDPWLGLSLSDLDEGEAMQALRRSWASSPALGTAFTARKTHQAWSPAADGYSARWQPADARVVYVVRDPRAVAVSWAHHNGFSHLESVESMTQSWAQGGELRLPHLAHPSWVAGSWSTHVTSWLDQAELPVLTVTYEGMSADPVGTLQAIVEWLEIDADAEACERAVARCSFASLAAQELIEGFTEAAAVDRVFFRRGSVDSWREELSPELIARIELEHGDAMRRLGYLD